MDRIIAAGRPIQIVFGRPKNDEDPMRAAMFPPPRARPNPIAIGATSQRLADMTLFDLANPPPEYTSFREPTPGVTTEPAIQSPHPLGAASSHHII